MFKARFTNEELSRPITGRLRVVAGHPWTVDTWVVVDDRGIVFVAGNNFAWLDIQDCLAFVRARGAA